MIPQMSVSWKKMLCRCLLISGFAVGITMKTEGQQAMEPSNIRFGVISSQQGLSQSSVFSLAQDQLGFLWII